MVSASVQDQGVGFERFRGSMRECFGEFSPLGRGEDIVKMRPG
jgi:hypothetical protein